MSRNSGSKPAASRNGVNPLWTGILVGLIVGVALAAGLTWYLMKSPSPFLQKEQVVVNPPAEAAKPAAPAENTASMPKSPAAAPGETSGKPRFEFYKVLTDKQDATVAAPAKRADKPKQRTARWRIPSPLRLMSRMFCRQFFPQGRRCRKAQGQACSAWRRSQCPVCDYSQ